MGRSYRQPSTARASGLLRGFVGMVLEYSEPSTCQGVFCWEYSIPSPMHHRPAGEQGRPGNLPAVQNHAGRRASGPRADTRVWPGRPSPIGATWDGLGVNFALFSRHATAVDLCLFESADGSETSRIPLQGHMDHVWHAYLPDARPGELYGYRVHGPFDPARGHRFNPHKLLIDPYARQISGP